MPQASRIKTPLKQHLHRFRIGVLPLLSFVGCVILTLWLWQKTVTVASILGEVEAHTATAVAGADGTISDPDNGVYWQRFDEVVAGQPIARLDDSQLLAQLRTIEKQSEKLLADLEAARISFRMDETNLLQNANQEKVRLTWEEERLEIEVLQQSSRVRDLTSQLDGAKSRLRVLEDLNRQREGMVRQTQIAERQRQVAALEEQLAVARRIGRELVAQLNEAKSRSSAYADLDIPDIQAVLAPIQADREVQQALMDEIRSQMNTLLVTAPINGVVSVVHKVPGEHVLAGDEIITIVRPDSSYVIGYVRENQRVPLHEGMSVGLRVRGNPTAPEYRSVIERVGPHVQPVPPHQLSDRTTPEWGSPIYIPIPTELQRTEVRPGELLQVIFQSRHANNN